jgi:hypothetical protein
MRSFESKPPCLQNRHTRLSSLTGPAGEWAASMIVWVVVCGMGLSIVSVLLAPVE